MQRTARSVLPPGAVHDAFSQEVVFDCAPFIMETEPWRGSATGFAFVSLDIDGRNVTGLSCVAAENTG
jgi:hypothetical protein